MLDSLVCACLQILSSWLVLDVNVSPFNSTIGWCTSVPLFWQLGTRSKYPLHKRSNMGKSEVYKLLEDNCKDAFVVEDDTVARSYEGVVIFDMMVYLRFVGQSMRSKNIQSVTLRDIIDRVFREAVSQLLSTEIVVALFDKADFVTEAKAAEQEMRDSANPSCEGELPKLWSGAPDEDIDDISTSGRAWGDLINHRESRVEIVWRICEEFARYMPDRLNKLNVPVTHTMILDYQDRNREPAVWEVGNGAATSAPYWHNSLGEFDVAYLKYCSDPVCEEIAQSVQDRTQVKQAMLVVSSDSDILPIEMLNMDAGNRDVHIRRTKGKLRTRVITFPRVVAAYIDKNMSHVPDPIMDFALSFILAGSDFVSGVPNVGNRKFMEHRMSASADKSPFDVFKELLDKSRNAVPTKRRRVTQGAALRESGGRGDSRASAIPCRQEGSKSKPFLDPDEAWKRAKFIANYWKYSVHQSHMQIPTCIGHGWCKNGTKVEIVGRGR